MTVICNKSGKTLSCKTCFHGKPHIEDYNFPLVLRLSTGYATKENRRLKRNACR